MPRREKDGIVLFVSFLLWGGTGCGFVSSQREAPVHSELSRALEAKDETIGDATETIASLARRIDELECERRSLREDLESREIELGLANARSANRANVERLLASLDACEIEKQGLEDRAKSLERAWRDGLEREHSLESDLACLSSHVGATGLDPDTGNPIDGDAGLQPDELFGPTPVILDPEISLRLHRLRRLEARLLARAQAEASGLPEAFLPEDGATGSEDLEDHTLYREDPAGLCAEITGLLSERFANLVYGAGRWDAFDGIALCALLFGLVFGAWLAGEPIRRINRRRLERELEIFRRRTRELENHCREMGADHLLIFASVAANGKAAAGETKIGPSKTGGSQSASAEAVHAGAERRPSTPQNPEPAEATKSFTEALERALPEDDATRAVTEGQKRDGPAVEGAEKATRPNEPETVPAAEEARDPARRPSSRYSRAPAEDALVSNVAHDAESRESSEDLESAERAGAEQNLASLAREEPNLCDAGDSEASFDSSEISPAVLAADAPPRSGTPIVVVDALWPELPLDADSELEGECAGGAALAEAVPLVVSGAPEPRAVEACVPASSESLGDWVPETRDGTDTFLLEGREVEEVERSLDAVAAQTKTDCISAVDPLVAESPDSAPSPESSSSAPLPPEGGGAPSDTPAERDENARKRSPAERDKDRAPTGNTGILDELEDLIGEAFDGRLG